jgi:hypothetical protein
LLTVGALATVVVFQVKKNNSMHAWFTVYRLWHFYNWFFNLCLFE